MGEILRLARPILFHCFLPASRSRDYSHLIRLEKSCYSEVLMRPGLRCGIQTCPGTMCFLCIKTKTFEKVFQTKRKGRTTLFGAGYTKCQPEMIFLNMFRAKNVLLWLTIGTPKYCLLNSVNRWC